MSAEIEKRFQSSNKCWICNNFFVAGDDKVIDNDSHLIMQQIGKFDIKISVIQNGLEKYMAFTINKNSVFIDKMQFMNSTQDALVKSLSDNGFTYL